MIFIHFLQTTPIALYIFVSLFGLIIGSFLNVVIYRLPKMLEDEWLEQCRMLTQPSSSNKIIATPSSYNLSRPRLHCSHCSHTLTAIENIPIISYLLLRGRCSACHKHISLRYPGIEALSALLAFFMAWQFGFGLALLGALILTWFLIAITFIDIDHHLIPDNLTLSLLWIGLFFNVFNIYTSLQSAVIGAIAAYLTLWIIAKAFTLITHKKGMGHGDFKLFAVFGAWLGWQALPIVIIIASFLGAIVGILLLIIQKRQTDSPIAFGPFLAIGGLIALVWGPQIIHFYLLKSQLLN